MSIQEVGYCALFRVRVRVHVRKSACCASTSTRSLDHGQSYKLLDGQWYLVEYECVEIARRESHLRWDVAERKHVRLTWGDNRVAIGKRQSNREEVHWIRARIAAREKQVRRM